MNSKAKGNRQEHRAMAYWEARGYRCSRSAASLGVFDCICIGRKGQGVLLVQVKSNRWPRSAEMQILREFEVDSCCCKLIMRYRDRVKEPDIVEI